MIKEEKCHNCGASLEISKANYLGEIKCKYCRTNYHLDMFGRIEEYKVKLLWNNMKIEAYLNSVEVKQNYVDTTWVDSKGKQNIVCTPPTFYLEFIGYPVEEIKEV